jgi:hypothetical protein
MVEPNPARIVALGASNLIRGFPTVVATARAAWGRDIEVLAALGHGRSYGGRSTILIRTLPGILQCGLWAKLDDMPAAATRALVTDVGNDLMFGHSPLTILGWVEECIDRLQKHTGDIVLTDLPMASIRTIPPWKYLLFRTMFFPWSRLKLRSVLDNAELLQDGLLTLAERRGVRIFFLRPEWYGFDPIHIRPWLWREAWGEILLGDRESFARASRAEAWRLRLHPPERLWWLGIERVRKTSGLQLKSGGCVWLY